MDGVDFEEAWKTRERVMLEDSGGDLETGILGLEMLIQNKRASGRPKDLDDLAFLEKRNS